ncbi:MAG: hypothetical protein V2A54_07320 [Bacteroidota bacterium]
MRKTFIILLILCVPFIIKAQAKFATSDQIAAFFKTKTMLVLDEDPFSPGNIELEDAFKKFWKITPYEIIKMEDFESKRKNPALSFVMISQASYTEREEVTNITLLNFVLGSKTGSFTAMPDLGSIPLSIREEDEESFDYLIPLLVQFLQSQIRYLNDHPETDMKNMPDYYNTFTKDIITKELWIPQAALTADVNTLEKIKGIYPGKVKIVTTEEIEKAIAARMENVLTTHIVGPVAGATKGKCWKMVISAKDGKAYYVAEHFVNEDKQSGLLEKDFKTFAK